MKHFTWVSGCAVMLGAAVLAAACGKNGESLFSDAPGSDPNGNTDPNVNPGGFHPGDGGADDFDAGNAFDDFDAGSCATGIAAADRTPVYMQLVVDGSGSMDGRKSNGDCCEPNSRETDPLKTSRQTGKRWIALRGALLAFFDELKAKPDPNLAVGMYLFSSSSSKPADKVDIPISFVNASHANALRERIVPDTFPSGGTPLTASMEGQAPILRAYAPKAPVPTGGKHVLVVMTDGAPSDGKTASKNAAAAALAGSPSVLTFVVGVGDPENPDTTSFDEVFLGDLAEAGGTAKQGCNTNWSDSDTSGFPCHFQITPGAKTATQIQQEFVSAINAIRGGVTSCELTINFGSNPVDLDKVNVALSSGGTTTQIPQDPTNGWTYDNPTSPKKVILHGDSCSTLKNDPGAQARIFIGCKTITPSDPK